MSHCGLKSWNIKFLPYLLNFWTFCNQTWCSSASSWAGLFCGSLIVLDCCSQGHVHSEGWHLQGIFSKPVILWGVSFLTRWQTVFSLSFLFHSISRMFVTRTLTFPSKMFVISICHPFVSRTFVAFVLSFPKQILFFMAKRNAAVWMEDLVYPTQCREWLTKKLLI